MYYLYFNDEDLTFIINKKVLRKSTSNHNSNNLVWLQNICKRLSEVRSAYMQLKPMHEMVIHREVSLIQGQGNAPTDVEVQLGNSKPDEFDFEMFSHLLNSLTIKLYHSYCGQDMISKQDDIEFISISITLCARSMGLWTAIAALSSIESAHISRVIEEQKSLASIMPGELDRRGCHPLCILGLDGIIDFSDVIVHISNQIVSSLKSDQKNNSNDSEGFVRDIKFMFPPLTSHCSQDEDQQDCRDPSDDVTEEQRSRKPPTWSELETILLSNLERHWVKILMSEGLIPQVSLALCLLRALLKSVSPEHNPIKGGWRASGKGSDLSNKLGCASETFISNAMKELRGAMVRLRNSVPVEDTFSLHLRHYIEDGIQHIPPLSILTNVSPSVLSDAMKALQEAMAMLQSNCVKNSQQSNKIAKLCFTFKKCVINLAGAIFANSIEIMIAVSCYSVRALLRSIRSVQGNESDLSVALTQRLNVLRTEAVR